MLWVFLVTKKINTMSKNSILSLLPLCGLTVFSKNTATASLQLNTMLPWQNDYNRYVTKLNIHWHMTL